VDIDYEKALLWYLKCYENNRENEKVIKFINIVEPNINRRNDSVFEN